jgi:ribosome-associated protein
VEGSLMLDTPSASPEKISEKINWMVAIDAAESKKAHDVKVLDLREVTSFTDYFVICSSASARQSKAIADEVGKALKQIGELPVSAEGYDSGDWILLDYGDFIVHIFSESARSYYDLERLWRHARNVEYPVVEKAS